MGDSFFKRVLRKLGRQRLGPEEIYRMQTAMHLGVDDLDIAIKLMTEDPFEGLSSSLTYHCNELLPHAANVLGMGSQELQRHLKGISLLRPEQSSVVNGWTEFTGRDFRISINLALMIFFWHMAKLWATRIGVMETPGHPIEGTRFSPDQTASFAKKLMVAFYENRLHETEIIPVLQLTRNQTVFAGLLCICGERFVIAHELGHVVIRFDTSNRISDLLDWAVSQSSLIVSFIVDKWQDWPRCAEVIDWGREKFAQEWGTEFVADLLGMNIALAASHDDRERIYSYWALESLFAMSDMLEQSFTRVYGRMYPLTSHPFSKVRREMLRKAVQSPSDPSILEFGRALEDICEAITTRI